MEDELSTRLEVIDRMKGQVRDLEKDHRDAKRMYDEQVEYFKYSITFLLLTAVFIGKSSQLRATNILR